MQRKVALCATWWLCGHFFCFIHEWYQPNPHVPPALSDFLAHFCNEVANDFMSSQDALHVPHPQSSSLAHRSVQIYSILTCISNITDLTALANVRKQQIKRVVQTRRFFMPALTIGSTVLGFGGAYYDYEHPPRQTTELFPMNSFQNCRFLLDSKSNEIVMRYDGALIMLLRIVFGLHFNFTQTQDVVIFHPHVFKALAANPHLFPVPIQAFIPHLIIFWRTTVEKIHEITTEYPDVDNYKLNSMVPRHPFDDSKFDISMSKCLDTYNGSVIYCVFQDSFPVHVEAEAVHNTLESLVDVQLLHALVDGSSYVSPPPSFSSSLALLPSRSSFCAVGFMSIAAVALCIYWIFMTTENIAGVKVNVEVL